MPALAFQVRSVAPVKLPARVAVTVSDVELPRTTFGDEVLLEIVNPLVGVVLPPEATFAMWVGAVVFWWKGRSKPAPGTRAHDFWVEGLEPICAGLISGAALIGIGNAIINVLID